MDTHVEFQGTTQFVHLHPAEPGSGDVHADDALGVYLREISAFPLLTAEEDVALATTIAHGEVAARRLRGVDALPEEERLALEQCCRDGTRARHRLVKANFRLVISIAKRYVGRGVTLADLIQEGNLGLLRAVERFDHRLGYKFSTYATWWIRQAVARAIVNHGRTIRVPAHVFDQINQLRRTARKLAQQLGREATVEELAGASAVPLKQVVALLRISQSPLSLEMPVGEDEESLLGDFIEDDSTATPGEAIVRQLLSEHVDAVLAALSPREGRVLQLRFGLEDGHQRTLEEVGQHFGVTRERIRQIESKTLSKLRHPSRSQKLRDYLE
ncbi:MAG TPA: sigma-70 family RNA polymerase sigma factor [Ardenticatenaceae bacterium]|nr:sigma-70 family RNA polymerase sigma factor [Ardenticatenaceae bacterium]